MLVFHIFIIFEKNKKMPKTKKKIKFRRKRGDTKMGTIEKIYGKDFGVRSDKKLRKYLKEKGYSSLSELLKSSKSK